MQSVIRCLIVLLLCSLAEAQNPSVVRKVLGSPGPNFFFVSPSMALNDKSRITFVVWEKHPGNHPDHATLIRKISPAGAFKGSAKTLIGGTNTYQPKLLYNSTENEFIVVYADEVRNSLHTVYIQRLDATGKKKGEPVQISTDSGGTDFVNHSAFAVYDPSTNRYIVVWARNSTQPSSVIPGEGLYAVALDADLVTVAGPTLIRPERSAPVIENPQVRDIAVLSSGKVLLAFTETASVNPNKSTYYVASFHSDLSGLKVAKVNNTPAGVQNLAASFAELPSSAFVYFVYNNGVIRKRKIDASGKPVGSLSPAFSGRLRSASLYWPAFASTGIATGSPAGFIVAVEDPLQTGSSGAIWMQSVDAKGKSIGAPAVVETDFVSAFDPQIVKLPSSTGSQLKFSLVYVNGHQMSLPPQGESSELIHLKITLPSP